MDSGKRIVLVGGFIESIELINQVGYVIAGVIDTDADKVASPYRKGLSYLGNDDVLSDADFRREYSQLPFFLSPDLPKIRRNLYERYKQNQCEFINVVSPKANIAPTAILEDRSSIMIQNGVNISSSVRIGKGVRINSCANVMHDCILGDFATVAPNAVLLGNVTIGANCYVGANATILPGITIGDFATVGAGAVVTRNVAEGITVVGNPARKQEKSK